MFRILYFYRGLRITGTPFFGSRVIPKPQSNLSVPNKSSLKISKFRSTLDSIVFISIMAKYFPTQEREPAMKGMYVNGFIVLSGPKLSGLNFSASGPQYAGSRWIKD